MHRGYTMDKTIVVIPHISATANSHDKMHSVKLIHSPTVTHYHLRFNGYPPAEPGLVSFPTSSLPAPVWLSGSMLVLIKEVILSQTQSVLGQVTIRTGKPLHVVQSFKTKSSSQASSSSSFIS